MIKSHKDCIVIKKENHSRVVPFMDLIGEPVPTGRIIDQEPETIPWDNIQAALDEAGIDLDSPEIQAIIEEQKKAPEVEPVSKEELKKQAQKEAERLALKEVLQERIEADPYLTAIANVKQKIDNGEINENAGKAIRDELAN